LEGIGRECHVRFRHDLADWLSRVGLAYHAPHKLRHGFIEHAAILAYSIEEYKAVQAAAMHASLSVTERYRRLPGAEALARFSGLFRGDLAVDGKMGETEGGDRKGRPRGGGLPGGARRAPGLLAGLPLGRLFS